jgi:hypothetical protein
MRRHEDYNLLKACILKHHGSQPVGCGARHMSKLTPVVHTREQVPRSLMASSLPFPPAGPVWGACMMACAR